MPQSLSHNQPSPSELQEMSQKAQETVHLLEDFEKTHLSENECTNIADPLHGLSEDHRAPKRPWEDMGQEDFPNSDQAGDVCHLMSPLVWIETNWFCSSSLQVIKPKPLLSRTCKLSVASAPLAQQGYKTLPAKQRVNTGREV